MSAPYREATEAELMVLVTELAAIYGWKWAHFRPARTKYGWVTPGSGPHGKGWFDLVLSREKDGRMLMVELKSEYGRLTQEQKEVAAHYRIVASRHGWLEVHVWRPGMFDEIQATLR